MPDTSFVPVHNVIAVHLCWIMVAEVAPIPILPSVVERVDGTTHWINHYQLVTSINFDSPYVLDIDLSSG